MSEMKDRKKSPKPTIPTKGFLSNYSRRFKPCTTDKIKYMNTTRNSFKPKVNFQVHRNGSQDKGVMSSGDSTLFSRIKSTENYKIIKKVSTSQDDIDKSNLKNYKSVINLSIADSNIKFQRITKVSIDKDGKDVSVNSVKESIVSSNPKLCPIPATKSSKINTTKKVPLGYVKLDRDSGTTSPYGMRASSAREK